MLPRIWFSALCVLLQQQTPYCLFLSIRGRFLCKAASKAKPVHTFHHTDPTHITIHICGIIESETEYRIAIPSAVSSSSSSLPETVSSQHGQQQLPYNETTIRGRTFRDTVTYLYEDDDNNNENDNAKEIENNNCNNDTQKQEKQHQRGCVGIRTHKVAVGQGYTINVNRRLIRKGDTVSQIMNRKHTTSTDLLFVDGMDISMYGLDVRTDYDRLLMTNVVTFDEDSGRTDNVAVKSSQLFQRI